MRVEAFIAAGALALSLGGCVGHPMAFPANDQARAIGNLRIEIKMYGTGSGPVKVTMPDGEVLVGRYSVNVGGSMSFGSIYGSVYGAGGYVGASGYTQSTNMAVSSPGVVDASGPKTTMQCEVMNNNMTGHGNGACRLDNGALYRIQY